MSCQHCASTEVQPFSPVGHAETHGAVLLCRGCRRISIALPSRTRLPKPSQALISLPKAA
jgi:hypothetical protein